jgi:2'-5' RNA ligase
MYRLFVAIDLPEEVRQALARVSCDVPGARWIEPEQIHLTLRFIGEVDGAAFRDVAGSLDEVAARNFPLVVRGVGHFPPRGEPRVLWAGVEKSDALVELRNRVESAVVRAGIEPEGRKFSPHVTLARLKGTPERAVGSFLALNGLLRCDPFRVREFHLYSSSLSAKRAVHRCEASYRLVGEDGAG